MSVEQGIKDYLNPNERFAERIKRSLNRRNSSEENEAVDEQAHLFTKEAKVNLLKEPSKLVIKNSN